MLPKTPIAKRERSPVTTQQVADGFKSLLPWTATSRRKSFPCVVTRSKAAQMAAMNARSSKKTATAAPLAQDETPGQSQDIIVAIDDATSAVPTNSLLFETYTAMVAQQRVAFAGLGLMDNYADDVANLAHWMVRLAESYVLKEETIYSGIYLLFTYVAHIRRAGGGDFVQYKARDVIIFKDSESGQKLYFKISPLFKGGLQRTKHFFAIAATCLCIASKMEENNFDSMVRPGGIIRRMQQEGHVVGEYAIFDFITIERDILATLEWRLFRVHTPIPFIKMLFHQFSIGSENQAATQILLATCLSSAQMVLTAPSDLAVVCLVAALRKNNDMASFAGIAQFSCTRACYLIEKSTVVLALTCPGLLLPGMRGATLELSDSSIDEIEAF